MALNVHNFGITNSHCNVTRRPNFIQSFDPQNRIPQQFPFNFILYTHFIVKLYFVQRVAVDLFGCIITPPEKQIVFLCDDCCFNGGHYTIFWEYFWHNIKYFV